MAEKITVSERGINLIKAFEGFRPTPYHCIAGYSTIGIGHRILPHESFVSISEEEAEDILRKDLSKTERAVSRLIRVPLTQNQFDALCSFTFNLGAGALQRSTLRMKVNREEHDEVFDEFMKWIYAGGRKIRGLIRRRFAEACLYGER
ncbi:MAG: lysozyme [bacterium]